MTAPFIMPFVFSSASISQETQGLSPYYPKALSVRYFGLPYTLRLTIQLVMCYSTTTQANQAFVYAPQS